MLQRERTSTVSLPFNIVHAAHVNEDMNWSGENLFEIEKKLGAGAFGTVYMVRHAAWSCACDWTCVCVLCVCLTCVLFA